jgi:hypothetical protein
MTANRPCNCESWTATPPACLRIANKSTDLSSVGDVALSGKWFAVACSRAGLKIWSLKQSPSQLHGSCQLFLSLLEVDVFRRAGYIPVMIIFVCLALIYAVEIPTRLFSWSPGARLVGLFQFVTGIWLMYCTYAITVNLALGARAWV